MKFYNLAENEEFSLLWWTNKIKFEKTPLCSKYPKKHINSGQRIGTLNLKTKGKKKFGDFIWTWMSDCLVTDKVVDIFIKNNVNGYELWPVEIINLDLPYKVWELRTLGWAGMASRKSGIELNLKESCFDCNHLRYTSLKYPKHLINDKEWDGSDIFMVWPLPKYKFVSQKVYDIIKKEKLTGSSIVPVNEMELGSYNNGFSPGRLSYEMPVQRAKKLGEPLGIF